MTPRAYPGVVAGADALDAAPDEGVEEELAVRGGSALEPALLALLAVAVIAAMLLHRPDGGRTSARTAPPPAPTGLPASPVAVRQLNCPAPAGGTVCRTSHTMPRAFVAAVRTLLPQVATHYAASEWLRSSAGRDPGRLYSRLYEGRDAPAAITVLVQRSGDVLADAADPRADANQIVVRGRQRVGRFVVDVRISAPAAVAPTRAQVNELARDPRLVVGR